MKNGSKMLIVLIFMCLLSTGVAFSQVDAQGCKDHPLFTRMQNFYIGRCGAEDFGQFEFVNEKGEKDTVGGKIYIIDYEIKQGFTPPSALQVIRNYENAIKKIGGVKVYQEDEYEIWLKLNKEGKTFWVYVDSWHGGGKGETYGITIVERKSMVQEVVADAKSIETDIKTQGKVAIYGIYFDFNKADMKPESEPTIKEIAKLLKNNPSLKLYVVRHTDNVGSIDYNMKLSKERADAVMRELISKHGIAADRLKAYGVGPLAPVASNKTEDGRAKNRRVELVEQ